jgi:hypothetical protein
MSKGLSATTKAAMVRKELIDMNALAPNGISLSSFSERASEDDKVDWLRHLRRLTAELVEERGGLTPIKAAIAHLDKEGAEDVISLAAEAILVGRALLILLITHSHSAIPNRTTHFHRARPQFSQPSSSNSEAGFERRKRA